MYLDQLGQEQQDVGVGGALEARHGVAPDERMGELGREQFKGVTGVDGLPLQDHLTIIFFGKLTKSFFTKKLLRKSAKISPKLKKNQ